MPPIIRIPAESDTRLLRSAQAGAVVWAALWLYHPGAAGPMGNAERLLLLNLLVLAPLALRLVGLQPAHHSVSWLPTLLTVLQPVGAAAALASFFLPRGQAAAACTLPWLALSGAAALHGLARAVIRRVWPAEELVIDAGLLFLPVGAGWLALSRYGARPLDFGDAIVFFTAVHFHFTGLIACVVAGRTGRTLLEVRPSLRRLYLVIVAGLIGGTPVVAAGITFAPVLELVGAGLLAGSLAVLAILTLRFLVPGPLGGASRVLLALSALSVFPAMAFAVAYAWGRFTGSADPAIPTMIHVHGALNAIGFALCGVLGWTAAGPKSGPPPASA